MELNAIHLTHMKAAAQVALDGSEDARDVEAWRREITPTRVLAMVEEVKRLRAELERLQAENAALREDKSRLNEQLERVNFVAAARAKDLQALQDSREAALNTKPDAAPVEPAPAREIAVGDRVRITGGLYKGLTGQVVVTRDDLAWVEGRNHFQGRCPIEWLEKL